jgi:hypothetical protein
MTFSGIRVGAIPVPILKLLKRPEHGLGVLTVYGKARSQHMIR